MKYDGKSFFEKIGIAIRSNGWRRSKAARLIIAVVLTLFLAGLFPQAQSPQNVTGYSVGALWTSADVTAPFSFRLLKDNQRYRQDVAKAQENFFPIFIIDTSAKRATLDTLEKILRVFSETSNESGRITPDVTSEEASVLSSYLQTQEKTVTAKQNTSPLFNQLEGIVSKLQSESYIIGSVPSAYSGNADQKAAVRKRESEEQIVFIRDLLTKEAVKNRIQQAIEHDLHASNEVKSAIAKITSASFVPNLSYSAEQTDESKKAITERVPKTDGVILEGQKIIGKGEVITPAAKAALERLAQARIDLGGSGAIVARALGTAGHVAIIVLLFVLYVNSYAAGSIKIMRSFC